MIAPYTVGDFAAVPETSAGICVYQAAPILLVDRHLVGQEKPRAEPGGLRAKGEHGRDSSSVANPTGRNDRRRLTRLNADPKGSDDARVPTGQSGAADQGPDPWTIG
jgi:hypothetical protein